MKKTKDKTVETTENYDLLLTDYISYRDELISYALRFDGCPDTAEDLFEDCHDKISKILPRLEAKVYVPYMKRSMGNLYTDHLRHAGYLDHCKFPEMFSPKASLELEEMVCRREEMGFLELALSRMSVKDQEILQGDLKPPVISSWIKYQALKRLERKVIEVIAERQTKNQNQSQVSQEKGRDQ